jgi:hypothetical protein
MPEQISVAYRISQNAASEADYIAFTVPPGKRFHITEIEAIFPSGSGGYLQLSVWHGIKQIAPYNGVWALDQGRAVARLDYMLLSGEKVIIHAKNSHETEARAATLQIEGELIGGGE